MGIAVIKRLGSMLLAEFGIGGEGGVVRGSRGHRCGCVRLYGDKQFLHKNMVLGAGVGG